VSVFTDEQPGEAVYVLLGGAVRVYTTLPDRTEVLLAVLGAGEWAGRCGQNFEEREQERGYLGLAGLEFMREKRG
jgi:CRP-like cAMP-binding protein